MSCASWSVFRYSLQERGQAKVDEGRNAWAGRDKGCRMNFMERVDDNVRDDTPIMV